MVLLSSFCEEDYAVTRYVVELVNTLTNVAYVALALRAMRRGHVDFMSASLFALGVCSFVFHATMRHATQFGDEIAMLGLMWSMLRGMLRAPDPDSLVAHIAGSVLAVGVPILSAFYVWSGELVYHVVVFLSMLALLISWSHWLMVWAPLECDARERRAWQWHTWRAVGICLVGYAAWLADLTYCEELRVTRAWMGLPWAWLLELHGWWHVMTAIGISEFMDVVRDMDRGLKKEKTK